MVEDSKVSTKHMQNKKWLLYYPGHTTVTTVSLITNIYLDWLRWLITKVEPGVLSESISEESIQKFSLPPQVIL